MLRLLLGSFSGDVARAVRHAATSPATYLTLRSLDSKDILFSGDLNIHNDVVLALRTGARSLISVNLKISGTNWAIEFQVHNDEETLTLLKTYSISLMINFLGLGLLKKQVDLRMSDCAGGIARQVTRDAGG